MMHREMDRADSPAGVTPPLPMLQAPLLAKLAQALSAKTGLDFCQTLVNELAHILGATAVWLTERVGLDRLRVLASHGIDVKEYALCDMPCQQLYRQGPSSSVPVSEPLTEYPDLPRASTITPSRCSIATVRSWAISPCCSRARPGPRIWTPS